MFAGGFMVLVITSIYYPLKRYAVANNTFGIKMPDIEKPRPPAALLPVPDDDEPESWMPDLPTYPPGSAYGFDEVDPLLLQPLSAVVAETPPLPGVDEQCALLPYESMKLDAVNTASVVLKDALLAYGDALRLLLDDADQARAEARFRGLTMSSNELVNPLTDALGSFGLGLLHMSKTLDEGSLSSAVDNFFHTTAAFPSIQSSLSEISSSLIPSTRSELNLTFNALHFDSFVHLAEIHVGCYEDPTDRRCLSLNRDSAPAPSPTTKKRGGDTSIPKSSSGFAAAGLSHLADDALAFIDSALSVVPFVTDTVSKQLHCHRLRSDIFRLGGRLADAADALQVVIDIESLNLGPSSTTETEAAGHWGGFKSVVPASTSSLSDSHAAQCRLYVLLSRFDDARASCKLGMDTAVVGDNVRAFGYAARLEEITGNVEAALEFYQHAVAARSVRAMQKNIRGERGGDDDEQSYGEIYAKMGEIHIKLRNYESAEKLFKKSIEYLFKEQIPLSVSDEKVSACD